jgi:hypothetical protein
MVDKEGWVYILTNEAMPGLVKIGCTMQDPAIHAEELSDSTAVPIPYVVNYKALVLDPKQIEQEVYGKLDSKRLDDKREFFKCEPFEAIRSIRDTGTVKYEWSIEEVDRKIQQQKEVESADKIESWKKSHDTGCGTVILILLALLSLGVLVSFLANN